MGVCQTDTDEGEVKVKIDRIETFLMHAAPPGQGGWAARNWLFVKVYTDDGLTGVGEASGWPRVVQTAIQDLTPLLIGEDPQHIERLWQKMMCSMMGHGMTGIVGAGAMTGIEMALWDLKGKALGVPVWNLFGGKMRDRVRIYAHAHTRERARTLVDEGYTAIKTGGIKNCVETVAAIRDEVGPEVDLMVDVHGPPWLTTRDAIALGHALEEFDLLFYEDPVAPENIEAIARVASAVDLPIAAGERHATMWGVRELIEREIVDVIQPDTGRAGGLLQMQKMAAMAEAHYITMAPHDGSLGPVAEMAAVHLMATLPNFLILEHLADDVPQRYEVMTGQPVIENSHIVVPDTPGLGIDIVEEAIAQYPSVGNVSVPEDTYDYSYIYARHARSQWLSGQQTPPPKYRPGHVF
ncbi:MAG: mandelate racemase/muconate lactonizing enzyme family protein [Gemmatimonadetes bacterium]|nr:mandelate racemase/muconate lactonizing enzyme family protein [Gemmatimonadota bacterium]